MKTVTEMTRELGGFAPTTKFLEAFAALVRADENKACQDVCDDVYRAWTLRDDEDETDPPDPIDCKLAIRARGNT